MPDKFSGIDFLTIQPEIWTPDHIECGREFRCVRDEFREYWADQLAIDIAGHVSRAFIIRDPECLAAYITISASSLEFKKVEGWRKQPLIAEGIDYTSLPAIKIGRLASDIKARKSGTRLLKWTLAYVAKDIAPRVGVRFMTLEALYAADEIDTITGTSPYDVSRFYREKFGFQYVDPNERLTSKTRYRSMFLDLKPMIETAKNPLPDTVDSLLEQARM
jgi:hypothetical protein